MLRKGRLAVAAADRVAHHINTAPVGQRLQPLA
jgi:hypothetical protein